MTMITQALKRWLDKLFSWWPWKRSSRSEFSQPINNLSLSSTQDSLRNTMPEGPIQQLGITSVVVEQERGDTSLTNEQPTSEESLMQQPHATIEGSISPSAPSLVDTTNFAQGQLSSTSTFEQNLLFLRYLVHQGIVNEGFVDGNTPRQYKRRK
jgi:hypothetical protein